MAIPSVGATISGFCVRLHPQPTVYFLLRLLFCHFLTFLGYVGGNLLTVLVGKLLGGDLSSASDQLIRLVRRSVLKSFALGSGELATCQIL